MKRTVLFTIVRELLEITMTSTMLKNLFILYKQVSGKCQIIEKPQEHKCALLYVANCHVVRTMMKAQLQNAAGLKLFYEYPPISSGLILLIVVQHQFQRSLNGLVTHILAVSLKPMPHGKGLALIAVTNTDGAHRISIVISAGTSKTGN